MSTEKCLYFSKAAVCEWSHYRSLMATHMLCRHSTTELPHSPPTVSNRNNLDEISSHNPLYFLDLIMDPVYYNNKTPVRQKKVSKQNKTENTLKTWILSCVSQLFPGMLLPWNVVNILSGILLGKTNFLFLRTYQL